MKRKNIWIWGHIEWKLQLSRSNHLCVLKILEECREWVIGQNIYKTAPPTPGLIFIACLFCQKTQGFLHYLIIFEWEVFLHLPLPLLPLLLPLFPLLLHLLLLLFPSRVVNVPGQALGHIGNNNDDDDDDDDYEEYSNDYHDFEEEEDDCECYDAVNDVDVADAILVSEWHPDKERVHDEGEAGEKEILVSLRQWSCRGWLFWE